MQLDQNCTGQLSIKEQLVELNNAASKLLFTMDDESWEAMIQVTQEWDERIQILVRGLSAQQIVELESEIKKIADKNIKIKENLEILRAKVLTQIQENNHSRNVIQQYSNSV